MENSGKRAVRVALLAIMLIASLAMTGCGKRLVMTRGYGKQDGHSAAEYGKAERAMI